MTVFFLLRTPTILDQPGEIGPATRLLSGWGMKFFDYDNDGDPDLFLVNGHPDDMIESRVPRVTHKEPLLMFENTGRAFKDVSAKSGAVFGKMFSGRGMALVTAKNGARSRCDIILDLSGGTPLFTAHETRARIIQRATIHVCEVRGRLHDVGRNLHDVG